MLERGNTMHSLRRLVTLGSLAILVFGISLANGGHTVAQTSTQFPVGLVAWWPADGNADDSVGGHSGTLVNGTTFAEGKIGQAFSLDGVDDTIDLGPGNIIGTGNSPFTISTWMYSTRRPTGLYFFTFRFNQDTQFFTAFDSDFIVSGDYVVSTFRGASHQWLYPIDETQILNHWAHVVVVYNGGDKSSADSFIHYINGVQLTGTPVDLGGVGGNCGLNDNVIGSDNSGPDPCGNAGFAYFKGLLDELQIYNRALSPAEIQSIYNGGTDTTPPELGDCPTGGSFLLNSGVQSVGPIEAEDPESGIDTNASTLTGSVDTSSVGTKTVTFTAVNNAGLLATKDCDYNVHLDFSGFFPPVDNPPMYNQMPAGRQVQFKFSLSGDQGMNIIAPNYPQSQRIDCNSQAPVDLVEETTTGPSGLRYDAVADQYLYAWQTNRAWSGTCRQFILRLDDGTDHIAYFQFR
jgi:hypothetical protein